MHRNKMIQYSLLHALGVMVYVIGVAFLMNNMEQILGNTPDTFWGPVAFLLLFTVSAAITGLLVLGRPVYLFMGGNKKEGVQFLLWTLGWLLVFTIIVFILVLTNHQ